jgi:hypothetical protein
MKTILVLYHESGSPKLRMQNIADSKVTQRSSEGTAGCNCDRWGHPFPNRAFREPSGSIADSNRNPAVGMGVTQTTNSVVGYYEPRDDGTDDPTSRAWRHTLTGRG